MNKVFRWSIVFTVLISQLLPVATYADNQFGVKDLKIPAMYSLGPCQTAVDLDCIESVSLIGERGEATSATHNSYRPNSPESYQDSNGNQIFIGNNYYRAGDVDLRLNVTLGTPGYILFVNSDGSKHTGAALRGYVEVANPLTTRVRIKVRTSWLRPMNVQIKMADADFDHTKLLGGNLWTFEGKGTQISDYTGDIESYRSKKAAEAKADVDRTEFSFIVHHAGLDAKSSFWPPICADKGYTVQSHNTNETGDPTWNSSEKNLEFAIYAPHLRADGTKNIGYFRLWTTHEFLDCKFPDNDLTTSPRLIVQILYEDGSVGVATTSVNNSNGRLDFFASGFHFSSPKVVVKRDPSVSPVAAPASQTPTPEPSLTSSPVADSLNPVPTTKTDTQGPVTPKSTAAASVPVAKIPPKALAGKTGRMVCVKGKARIVLKKGIQICPIGFRKS